MAVVCVAMELLQPFSSVVSVSRTIKPLKLQPRRRLLLSIKRPGSSSVVRTRAVREDRGRLETELEKSSMQLRSLFTGGRSEGRRVSLSVPALGALLQDPSDLLKSSLQLTHKYARSDLKRAEDFLVEAIQARLCQAFVL